jgi:hypothetical protein
MRLEGDRKTVSMLGGKGILNKTMQRLNILGNHFEGHETTESAAKKNSLSVLDNRTGNHSLHR